MPVPPTFDASTSGPYIYQQEFSKRQQIYQRQAALSLNRNRISSSNQQGNFASSGKLRIYPKELSKSPQLQQQQQPQPQEAQKKGLIDTSPLLSAFNNAAGNFNNFVSSSPPVSATPPPFQLSSSPQLQPYGSPQLQPYGSPQLQPYVQQIPQGPLAANNHFTHPNSLPNELPVGSASPPLHAIPYGASPGHAVAAHSLPGGGGGGVGSSGGYRSPYNPLSYPPLSDNLYQISPSAGHGQTLGFHIGPRHGGKPTTAKAGNACSFDVLDDLETLRSDFSPHGGGSGVITGTDVVCQGWEGGMDVWKVGRGVVELVARLEGLSGNVVEAKILPTLPRDDTNLSLRPLICLTLHSPVVSHNREAAALDSVQSPVLGPVSERPSSAQSHRHEGPEQPKPSDVASEYQTTVEIYSLSQRMRIATLFKSPPIPVLPGAGAPPPWNIRVEASAIPGQGNVVAVGIGGSGELYVYGSSKVGGSFKKRMSNIPDESEPGATSGWKCLTKLWTNVQAESKQTVADAASLLSGESVYTSNNGTPIFSLEGRWLAYSPIYVSSTNRNNHTSRGGDVTVNCLQALSQNPPTQPQTNTFVDVPKEEPILNRVAREVTQEVIRGAKWVGEHGMRAVKNYWNGYNSGLNGTSPPQSAANGVRIGPAPGSSGVSVLGMQVREMREREQDLASLGPGGAIGGHSTPGSSGGLATPPGFSYSSNDPAVVSLIDLGKPLGSSGRQEGFAPSSTFQPPLGVSFLSLAPGGLMLLTASIKGDVVLVWDLLKSAHQPGSAAASKGGQGSAKSATAQSQVGSPESLGLPVTNGRLPNGQYAGRHVRQVARFTRMTVAHIVDVSWTNPRGDKLAVLTDKRTVHFFDMPANAYQWPPPRRAIPPPSNQGAVGGMVNSTKQAASNLLATTQPLVVAARRRRSSGSSASAAASSGKGENGFNAAGYNSGGSGTGGNSAGNRIALPPAGTTPAVKGCVRFLGKEPGYVAMMAGGVLRIYESRKQGGGGRKKSSFLSGGVMTNDWLEYELPKPPDGVATGIVSSEPPSESSGQQQQQQYMNEIDPDDEEIAEMMVFPGFWAGKAPAYHVPQSPRMKDHHIRQYNENPLSFAEIETSPPRQPVHNDRHITLSVFSGPPSTHLISNLSKNKTWIFGQPLQVEKLDVGSAKGEVEFKNGSDGLAVTEAMESALRLEQNESGVQSKNVTAEGGAPAATRAKKKKGTKKATSTADMVATGGVPIDEGFFEDGCEVVIEDKKK